MLQMEHSQLLLFKMKNLLTQTEEILAYDPLHMCLYDTDGTPYNTTTLRKVLDKELSHHSKIHHNTEQDNKTKPILKYHSPVELRITVGYKCNSNCAYCIQDKSLPDPARITDSQIDEFTTVLLEYLDLSKLETLQFWGGEPLLYLDTILKIAHTLNRYNIGSDKLIMSFLTNGILLTKDVVDRCMEHNVHIGISHDGTGQVIRGNNCLKNKNSLQAIQYYLEHYRDIQQFHISTTITNGNIYKLQETEDYFKQLFGKEIMYRINSQPVMIHSPVQQLTDFKHDKNSSLAVLRYLLQHDNTGPHLFSNIVFHLLDHLTNPNYSIKPERVRCFIQSPYVLNLDLAGNVYPCQNYCNEDHKLGHISSLKHIAKPHCIPLKCRPTPCLTCPVVGLCIGGCGMSPWQPQSPGCTSSYIFYLGILAYGLYVLTDGKYLLTEILP